MQHCFFHSIYFFVGGIVIHGNSVIIVDVVIVIVVFAIVIISETISLQISVMLLHLPVVNHT